VTTLNWPPQPVATATGWEGSIQGSHTNLGGPIGPPASVSFSSPNSVQYVNGNPTEVQFVVELVSPDAPPSSSGATNTGNTFTIALNWTDNAGGSGSAPPVTKTMSAGVSSSATIAVPISPADGATVYTYILSISIAGCYVKTPNPGYTGSGGTGDSSGGSAKGPSSDQQRDFTEWQPNVTAPAPGWGGTQGGTEYSGGAYGANTFTLNMNWTAPWLDLAFLPVTILYCPPDANMTNSLTKSQVFGSVFALQTASNVSYQNQQSNGWSGETIMSAAVPTSLILGLPSSGSGGGPAPGSTVGGSPVGNINLYNLTLQNTDGSVSASQATFTGGSGQSTNFSFQWQSVLTADNRSAISSDYWGPLGDIFVIATDPVFAIQNRPDGAYSLVAQPPLGKIIVLPANKLLRPGTDAIANQIPWKTRQSLLALDPFITSDPNILSLFFPTDTGAPLSQAAVPTADPTIGNRAQFIAEWDLDNGTELTLNLVQQIQVTNTNSDEVVFAASNATSNADNGTLQLLGMISVAGSQTTTETYSTSITYEKSWETQLGTIVNAACSLVRSQTETDLSTIRLCWDKVFSTFMFQQVTTDFGISGVVLTPSKTGLANVTVTLEPVGSGASAAAPATSGLKPEIGGRDRVSLRATGDRKVIQTCTDERGRFTFVNLPKGGDYRLSVGDKQVRVTAQSRRVVPRSQPVVIQGVTRLVDLRSAPRWELQEIGIDEATARQIRRDILRDNLKPKKNQRAKSNADIVRHYKLPLKAMRLRAKLKDI
jgi:hypothetical protein